MKVLIALTMLAGAALARADSTYTQFTPAPEVQAAVPTGAMRCGGDAFNEDSSILGACASPHAYACSGRACQPVTITSYYNVTWAADGTPISAILCMSGRHHVPQPNTYTYYNGFAAGDCLTPVLSSATVVAIDVGFGPAPFYLIATSASGLTEVVADGSISYLVAF